MCKRYCYQISVLLLLCTAIGCKKFVSVSPPPTEVESSGIFNNDANAVAAQTAIYSQMQSSAESLLMSLRNGLMADELKNYCSNALEIEYYTNSLLSTKVSSPWIDAYSYIYQANAVINGLQKYSGVSAVSKQQLTGEAEFIRAFWNFYLVNCYGAVPLITTTDYTVNAVAQPASTSTIYTQIIADLLDAENKLNVNYVDATDSVVTGDRIRPTKWAAAAMLARVYLYTGANESAEQQSSLVIDGSNNQYQLCQTLDSVFLMNNTEAIWQLPPVQPSSNLAVPDGEFFIISKTPGGSRVYNNATISTQLLNSFEPGDLRASHWIGDYQHGGINYYYPYKYKLLQSNDLAEYTVVLRLAEQYLIRAEARAQQGNISGTSGALADLNVIRNRAGLPVYSGATDQQSVLAAILHERQVELFAEWGHRWFDLIRTKNIDNVMGTVTPLKGGSWSADWALYPIPFSEIASDPKLTQNPGYN